MADPKEAYRIPTREEHQRQVVRIWRTCATVGLGAFLFMLGTVVVMKALGYDSRGIVDVQLIVVYIFVPVYGLGFVAAALATSLLKMGVAVEMSREGLQITNKMNDSIESRLKKIDQTQTQLEKGEHPVLDRLERLFKREMRALRAEIRKERGAAEEELEEALEEGEREAAAIAGGDGLPPAPEAPVPAPVCPTCGTTHPPDGCPRY